MIQLDSLKPFIDWLQMHPNLASLAVFIISCAESLAIIGLFIPGSIVMPAIGSMVGAHVLPGPLILMAAILGAILGDGLSYWLGYHYHEKIRGYWPFNHFPRGLKLGETFFLKYGGLSVFIGRFAGPVRPIIPVVAGMMYMPPRRFLMANITSAIAWAIVYMAPGYFLGALSAQLAPHTAARLLVILAILTLVMWMLWWLAKRLWRWFEATMQSLAYTGWLSLSRHDNRWHRLQKLLLFPDQPRNHRPLLLLLTVLSSGIAFIVLTWAVHASAWLTWLNTPVYYILRSIEQPGVNQFMAYLRAFGSFSTYIIVLMVVSGGLVWQRRWRALFCWCANFISCWLVINVIKSILPILRPANNLLSFHTWSFPSLHGGLMLALFSGLVMLLLPDLHRRMWSKVILLGLFFACIAALPQLYFGFNWLSDEWGSMLIAISNGALWIILYYRGHVKAGLQPKPLLGLAIISFVLAGIVVAKVDSESFLQSMKIQAIKIAFSQQAWWHAKPLPVHVVRENMVGTPAELMNVQYVGSLGLLESNLTAKGWQTTPEPSLMIILNRIGAKNRLSQLPLIPDLYQGRKAVLIMTKAQHLPERMLILRVWATTVVMQPRQQPLWLGTIQYRRPWHFGRDSVTIATQTSVKLNAITALMEDLNGFSLVNKSFTLTACDPSNVNVSCAQTALFVRSRSK